MKNILLIEDDQNLSFMYQKKFELEGYQVQTELNGEDGLNTALKTHPDLILLDILMPKMDGMTVMKKLREDSWGANVPIIIISVLDPNDEMIEQVMKDKPTYYLLKATNNIDTLTDKVKEVIGK
jgi:DNA-binding response OmpR family regulator